jgi:mono/diheme cytochrome c family protein
VAQRRPAPQHRFDDEPQELSQNGHLLGVGVYGALLLVGFFFGIVTGYDRPRTITVAKVPKDSPKTDATTAPQPKAPETNPTTTLVPSTTPITNPVTNPAPPPKEMPEDPPPPKKEPPKIEVSAKVDVTPPKKDEPKEILKPVSFQKDVLPIFRTHCLNCHGAAGKPKGDVDLRTVAAIKKGGGGPILEIGKPDKSAVYTQIVDGSMPPNGKGPGKGELEVIRNWILTGAKPRRRPIPTRRSGRR